MIGEFRQIADNYGVPEEILEKIEYEIRSEEHTSELQSH